MAHSPICNLYGGMTVSVSLFDGPHEKQSRALCLSMGLSSHSRVSPLLLYYTYITERSVCYIVGIL